MGQGVEDNSLTEIFPAMSQGGTPEGQALSQFLAIIVTIVLAVVGGIITGAVMYVVAKLERMKGDDFYNDDWNIADMEEKEEIPKALIEDWKNAKLVGQPVVVTEKSTLMAQLVTEGTL